MLRRRSLDGDVVLDATDDRPEVSHSVATAAVDAGAIINDRLEEVANFVGKGQRPLVPIGWHKLVNDLHLLVAFFMLLLAHVPTSTLTARRLRGDRSPCAPCQHQFRSLRTGGRLSLLLRLQRQIQRTSRPLSRQASRT